MSNPKDWAVEAAEAVSACPCPKCIAPKADAIRTALAGEFVVISQEAYEKSRELAALVFGYPGAPPNAQKLAANVQVLLAPQERT